MKWASCVDYPLSIFLLLPLILALQLLLLLLFPLNFLEQGFLSSRANHVDRHESWKELAFLTCHHCCCLSAVLCLHFLSHCFFHLPCHCCSSVFWSNSAISLFIFAQVSNLSIATTFAFLLFTVSPPSLTHSNFIEELAFFSKKLHVLVDYCILL